MNININTRLGACAGPCKHMSMIQIGTTPCFTLDLDKHLLDFKDITQANFLFKQGSSDAMCFSLYDSTGAIDSHFVYDEITDAIVFTMKASETLNFVPTKCKKSLVDFEVVVIADNYVAADIDTKVFVIDSIYKGFVEV